ncbi:MAG: HU family DNA-binding protein [Succinivibrio sp.]|jgi:integration host factor subunit beta|nr:HU family DNA-binding protein [Succinivibrio sp.]MBR1612864.1 HU family DNA-binding protein [Succinivibrio sp.]
MTRAELIEKLAKTFPYQNPVTVDNAVREIFEIMIETLSAGDRIEIRGFGSFEVRIHEPRVAHNPKTGEQVSLSRRKVVHFKPGVELRDRVNSVKLN